jgi:hypothetical protein
MDDPHVIGLISRRLSRIDSIRASWVSKMFHKLFTPYTYARLTSAQEEAVEKILKLDLLQWRKHAFACTGDHFVIGSATSTGKTAIILAAAGRFVKEQQKQVIIGVPPLLVSQWVMEYRKFRLLFELPELFVFDGLDLKQWKVAPNGIALVTLPLLMNKSYETWRNQFNSQPWHVMFGDEVSSNPSWFRRNFPNCFLVSANATAKYSNISQVQVDAELGWLPQTRFYFHELNGYVYPTDFKPRFGVARKHIPYRDFVEAWAARLTHGQTLIAHFGGPETIPIDNETHRFPKAPKLRSAVLASFLSAPKGVMVVPAKSVKKGINLPVETLIVMVLEYRLIWEELVQLIGRVRRVQTQRRSVAIHVITTENSYWKDALMLHRTPDRIEPHHAGGLDAFRSAGYSVQDFTQPNIHTIKFLLDTPVNPPAEVILTPLPRAWRSGADHEVLFANYSVLLAFPPSMLVLQIHRGWDRLQLRQATISANSTPFDSWPPDLAREEDVINEFKARFLRLTGNFWEARHQFQAYQGHWKLVTFYVAEFFEDATIEQTAKRQKL